MKCMACGRKLNGKKSIERGYGPVCYKKLYGKRKPYNFYEDENYEVPGQISLSDLYDMGGNEHADSEVCL